MRQVDATFVQEKAASNVSESMALSSAKSSPKERMNNWLQLPFKQVPALSARGWYISKP